MGDPKLEVLSLEEAAFITELASKHGFKPAQPHRFDRLMPGEELDRFIEGYAQWRKQQTAPLIQ